MLNKNRRYPGLLSCKQCNFLTADISISDIDLKSLYGEDYFHGIEYADYIKEMNSLQTNFKKRLNTLLAYIQYPAKSKLFEIGCAYGFFLDVARHQFRSVEGIDISEKPTLYARNVLRLNASQLNFLEKDVGVGHDVYCMWDTIEHLGNPDEFIKKISEVINPEGILAITTGDIGSLNARIRGRHWRMIHPPTHLHYFSEQTISNLLVKYNFNVIHIEHPGTYRTLRMILSGLIMLGHEPKGWRRSLFNLCIKLPFIDINIPINLYDIMFVIAKKNKD